MRFRYILKRRQRRKKETLALAAEESES